MRPTYDMTQIHDGGRCQRRGTLHARRRLRPPNARPSPIVVCGRPSLRAVAAVPVPNTGLDVLPVLDLI